jgi:hypothetical protein
MRQGTSDSLLEVLRGACPDNRASRYFRRGSAEGKIRQAIRRPARSHASKNNARHFRSRALRSGAVAAGPDFGRGLHYPLAKCHTSWLAAFELLRAAVASNVLESSWPGTHTEAGEKGGGKDQL